MFKIGSKEISHIKLDETIKTGQVRIILEVIKYRGEALIENLKKLLNKCIKERTFLKNGIMPYQYY